MLLRDHLSSPLDFYLKRIDLGLRLHHSLLNALGKEILLRLNHLMRHRAKVKQVKDIDLEDLKVGELIQRVLELRLLSTQICPQRILELQLKVFDLEWLILVFLLFLAFFLLLFNQFQFLVLLLSYLM